MLFRSATTYQAAPSAIGQLAGLGTAAAGLSKMAGGKKGGFVKAGAGIDKLALRRALAGA